MSRALPSWEAGLIRKHPRVEFIEPARILCGGEIFSGRSRNLSLGGMLVEAALDFAPGTGLRVCFQLPNGRLLNPHARVVHCRPGARFGVAFTDLEEYELSALREFIQVDEFEQRRSIRLPQRLFVRMRWTESEHTMDAPAETVLLSQFGCLIFSRIAPQRDARLTLWWPEKKASAEARVVWRRAEPDNWVALALEFTEDTDFWGIDFKQMS